MGVDSLDVEALVRFEIGDEIGSAFLADAGAPHASVDLDVNGCGHPELLTPLGDELRLVFRADGKLEFGPNESLDLIFMDRSEDEDRKSDSSLSKLHRFFETRDAETIDSRLFGGSSNNSKTMSVGIPLDGKTE
jgi:hypothetical protein